jgi:hypothetical protein
MCNTYYDIVLIVMELIVRMEIKKKNILFIRSECFLYRQ